MLQILNDIQYFQIIFMKGKITIRGTIAVISRLTPLLTRGTLRPLAPV